MFFCNEFVVLEAFLIWHFFCIHIPQFGIKKIGLEFGSLQYYSYLCGCKSISYEQ